MPSGQQPGVGCSVTESGRLDRFHRGAADSLQGRQAHRNGLRDVCDTMSYYYICILSYNMREGHFAPLLTAMQRHLLIPLQNRGGKKKAARASRILHSKYLAYYVVERSTDPAGPTGTAWTSAREQGCTRGGGRGIGEFLTIPPEQSCFKTCRHGPKALTMASLREARKAACH